MPVAFGAGGGRVGAAETGCVTGVIGIAGVGAGTVGPKSVRPRFSGSVCAAADCGGGWKSLPVRLIFASSAGAWEQPKTVQPPFSAKHSGWCGAAHPGQSRRSPSPDPISVRQ